MKAEKQKRLADSGWTVGTADEFLGLTAAESVLVDMKLALAQELRKRRAHLHLSQEALARRLRSSQSRVAKMEAGDPGVSLDLRVGALLAAGTTRRRLAHVIAAA
jgi:hypothetical protein